MTQATAVTMVGGGLAGLTAAITCAEIGAGVVLHEARSILGGRARSPPPYVANDGTPAFYDDPPWRWLAAHGLVQPFAQRGIGQLARVRIRHGAGLHRVPPAGFIRLVTAGRRLQAPVDVSFRDWAGKRFGESVCRAAEGMVGPAIYDADPGRLSAAFVFERLLRVTTPKFPPVTRYPCGGWAAVVARMQRDARAKGVRIETNSRVGQLPEKGPMIVATSLEAARGGDETLRWESGRAALLDIGVRHGVRDPFGVRL